MSHEALGKSDEWYTPEYIFEALGTVFDLDVAPARFGESFVPANNMLCGNGLDSEWKGYVWMNPPFGKRNGLEPWLSKFFSHGNGIALTPDRTSAPWWQDAAKKADAILMISPKVRFFRPDWIYRRLTKQRNVIVRFRLKSGASITESVKPTWRFGDTSKRGEWK